MRTTGTGDRHFQGEDEAMAITGLGREPVELLCGCRCSEGHGAGIYRKCREARQLEQATDARNVLDYRDPQWTAFTAHYDAELNPVVRRQNRETGEWEDA